MMIFTIIFAEEDRYDIYCIKSVCLLTLSGSLRKSLVDIIVSPALWYHYINRTSVYKQMRNPCRIRSQYRAGRVLNRTFMKPWAKYAFFIISIDFVPATADGRKVSVTRGQRNRFYFTNNITTSTLVISITSENRSHNRVHGNSNRKIAAAC